MHIYHWLDATAMQFQKGEFAGDCSFPWLPAVHKWVQGETWVLMLNGASRGMSNWKVCASRVGEGTEEFGLVAI